MEQLMFAFTAAFLCSALLGLRVTFPAFLPFMMLAVVLAATQGLLVAAVVLVATQIGYVCGALARACVPSRQARPALRRVSANS